MSITQKKQAFFPLFGIAASYLTLLYCIIMILNDILMDTDLQSSLKSYSFTLTLVIIIMAASLASSKKIDDSFSKKSVYSFLVGSITLNTLFIITAAIAVFTLQAETSELPMLLMFVLPIILLYNIFDALLAAYNNLTRIKVLAINATLGIVIMVSVLNHFWLLGWLIVALLINVSFTIYKATR